MIDPPPQPPPLDYLSPAPPPPAPRNRPDWGARIAWIVIVLTVAVVIAGNTLGARGAGRAKGEIDPTKSSSLALRTIGYSAMGRGWLMGMADTGSGQAACKQANADSLAEVRAVAKSPLDRLRAVPLIAELDSNAAALSELDHLDLGAATRPSTGPAVTLADDAAALRTIYTMGPDALSPQARDSLLSRHDWFAKLALSSGKPASDPMRAQAITPARRMMAFLVGFLLLIAIAGLAGLVLFILAMVRLAQGRVIRAYRFAGLPPGGPYDPIRRPAGPGYLALPTVGAVYPTVGGCGYFGPEAQAYAAWPPGYIPSYESRWTPPPVQFAPQIPSETASDAALKSARTGPFVEAFAIYLAGQIVLSIVTWLIFPRAGLKTEWFMLLLLPAAFFWPLFRGISWPELRRGLGWHRGRGVFREMAAGLLGYIGGLPIFFVGVIITLYLNKVTSSTSTHPIENQVGRGLWSHAQLFLLACVWAPVVEETMFRGALFHHLRGRWQWIFSAPLVAVVFAAIHPQGWTAIPALGALAITLAALREWRGSSVAPMTAHFLNNLVVVTVLILVMS